MSETRTGCDHTLKDELHALASEVKALTERVTALDRLMEAKFVTFDVLVRSQAEKVGLALSAADKAVNKAEMATEKRFESVNEFRSSLADQANNLVTRTEFDAKEASLREIVNGLKDRINVSEGRGSGLHAGWGYLVGVVGVLAAFITMFMGLR